MSKRSRNVNQCQKSNIDIEQLCSFLKYDSSFFSPWTERSSGSPKHCPKYAMEMKFEAGSFFAFDVTALEHEGFDVNDEAKKKN
ncbi:hypothetical protein CTI12_AA189700 [Artemisia annua]|uniref:Uncharacterized protein n=1 Tax=Artemisia annua TaxID=35608 RepID=A0A2U1P585_ARTAN|nr:hypothetical protein CTI12_AA189700 [Artemisia annua]